MVTFHRHCGRIGVGEGERVIGPEREMRRLAVLGRLAVLDTAPEPAFDRIVELARRLCGARTAVVSLVAETRQWFKARVEMDACGSPRSESFCQYAIAQPRAVMVVPDARADPRLRHLSCVTGPPFIRFYAGAPLVVDGEAMGALCVLDPEPRFDFGPEEQALLASLAEPVSELLRLRLEAAERRALSRTLEFQARKLALAEQLAGVGHWSLEAGGEVTWSDEVYRIHGVDPAAFDPTYDDAVAFYDPVDRGRVSAQVERARRTGEGFAFKARLTRRSDGAVRTVLTKGEHRAADEDAPAMLFGVFQDVTDQDALLQKTQDSEQRYRMLAERANDMIAETAPDSTVRFVSAACQGVLGYEPQELVGRRTMDLTHPDDLPRVMGYFADLIAAGPAGRGMPYQFRGRRKDGSWAWLEGRPHVRFDAGGQPAAIQDVVRDVGARKALEEAREAARLAAEASVSAKSDFLANVSHELRTPLTGILGYAEVLAHEPGLPASARVCAGRIGEAGRSLLTLVNDVLDLSKIEASGVELKPEPVDLAALAASALDLMRPQAAAKALRLRLDRPAALTVVEADPARLRQVLLNLLSNAVKFTEAGEVRLTVSAADAGEGRTRVSFAVRDSGVGIAPERLEQVFGRFEQADASISRRYGGAGLGLAISRSLMAAMGGVLEAWSEPGRGSVFTAAFCAPTVSTRSGGGAAGGRGDPSPLLGLRVLLAEDVEMNREMIALLLKPAGVRLTTARDGAEAVAAAGAEPFDVILMDMQMPRVDGLEATRRIRSGAGPNRLTPVVALTANVLPEEVARCRAAGMTGHVGKPFTAQRLHRALEEAVASAGSPASEQAAAPSGT